eukprot:6177452-Pleurochrysis_carterae.AAC.1
MAIFFSAHARFCPSCSTLMHRVLYFSPRRRAFACTCASERHSNGVHFQALAGQYRKNLEMA